MTNSALRRLCVVSVLTGIPATVMAQAPAPARVTLKAPDGISLQASYFSAGRPGPGILLLHQCNRDRQTWTALATHAAARGYHVIAFDYRGFGESEGTRFDNFQDYQPVIAEKWPGDADAAFAWLLAQPGIDRDRIGVAGASCGVNQAILLARRHPEVKTIALLSGGTTTEGRDYLRQAAWMPIFAAASRADGDAVNTMRWTLGWSRNPSNQFVEFKTAGHGTEMFSEKNLEPAMLEWFDAHLKTAETTPRSTTGASSTPTVVEEFWTALTSPGGAERAWRIYDVERRRNPKLVLVPEAELNAYGYQRLQLGHPTEAVELFKLNIDAYPRSANAYDSLSDAYFAAGKRGDALAAAEMALKLLPGDHSLPEEFRNTLRENLEKKIRDLR